MQKSFKNETKVKPRKLPAIRWKTANPEDYQPQPPPDMATFQGICVSIDEKKFWEFIEECKKESK
jgi:hypothetical protein